MNSGNLSVQRMVLISFDFSSKEVVSPPLTGKTRLYINTPYRGQFRQRENCWNEFNWGQSRTNTEIHYRLPADYRDLDKRLCDIQGVGKPKKFQTKKVVIGIPTLSRVFLSGVSQPSVLVQHMSSYIFSGFNSATTFQSTKRLDMNLFALICIIILLYQSNTVVAATLGLCLNGWLLYRMWTSQRKKLNKFDIFVLQIMLSDFLQCLFQAILQVFALHLVRLQPLFSLPHFFQNTCLFIRNYSIITVLFKSIIQATKYTILCWWSATTGWEWVHALLYWLWQPYHTSGTNCEFHRQLNFNQWKI